MAPRLTQITDIQERMKTDYEMSKMLRSKFRVRPWLSLILFAFLFYFHAFLSFMIRIRLSCPTLHTHHVLELTVDSVLDSKERAIGTGRRGAAQGFGHSAVAFQSGGLRTRGQSGLRQPHALHLCRHAAPRRSLQSQVRVDFW